MNNELWYTKPAKHFEEALPIGNGSLGAMVYGGVAHDMLSLNHDTLWSGKPKRTIMPNAKSAYRKAREMTAAGRVDEAEDILCSDFNADWSQNYLPLGNLHIYSDAVDFDEYVRKLDMHSAIVSVVFKSSKSASNREYFASHSEDAIIIKYNDSSPHNYIISIDSQLKYTVEIISDCIILHGECPSDLIPGDRAADNPCTYDGEGIKFTAIIRVLSDGKVHPGNGRLCVENSTDMRIYVAVKTSYINYNMLPVGETEEACRRKINEAAGKNYISLKEAHAKDFSMFYDRTYIDLGGNNGLPTDELLKSGSDYKTLAELMFNYAKYLMISSSRPGSQAMNLQGIWNEQFQPPWCSSYTLNINTEMNYWPALSLDLPEMYEPLEKLAEKLADTGKTTAGEYYNAPGYVSHHVSDLWGMSTACGPNTAHNCCWAFWNMSSAWLVNEIYKKYEYTLDKVYLKDTVYPLIKPLVEFYVSQLVESDGKLIMLMSTSPENRYKINGKNKSLAKYTAMTQQLLIVLFSDFIACSKILGVDFALAEKLREMIPKLYTFVIGSRGQLLEWDKEYEENDIHHRHVSHLYGVYPGGLFTEQKNRQLYESSKKSLEIRGDWGTGWSIAWKMNLWGRFKDGNHSFSVFKNQMKLAEHEGEPHDKDGLKIIKTVGVNGGTYPNLLDAHPPFQIDGNFGAAMGIIQWFVQCEDGIVKILPALPEEIRHGKVCGLIAEGNIKIRIAWEKHECTYLSAVSPITQTAVFEVNGRRIEVKLEKEKRVEVLAK